MAARKKQAGRKGGKARKAAPRGGAKASARGRRTAKPEASAYPEVEALVELMDRHGLLEVDFETGDDGVRRIRLARGGGLSEYVAHAPVRHAASAAAAPEAARDAAAAAPVAAPAAQENLHAFKSPMVGTFYRAPSPESSPFVSVGDRVDPSGTVCIIEAMKVMNEIVPDAAGEVVSIEVENGEAVEYGQTLFLIRTA